MYTTINESTLTICTSHAHYLYNMYVHIHNTRILTTLELSLSLAEVSCNYTSILLPSVFLWSSCDHQEVVRQVVEGAVLLICLWDVDPTTQPCNSVGLKRVHSAHNGQCLQCHVNAVAEQLQVSRNDFRAPNDFSGEHAPRLVLLLEGLVLECESGHTRLSWLHWSEGSETKLCMKCS